MFYIDAVGDLVSAEVRPGPPLTTTPRRLFNMAIEFAGVSNDRAGVRMFDVTPDGSRFVALRGAGAERIGDLVDVVLVENWLEELKATLVR